MSTEENSPVVIEESSLDRFEAIKNFTQPLIDDRKVSGNEYRAFYGMLGEAELVSDLTKKTQYYDAVKYNVREFNQRYTSDTGRSISVDMVGFVNSDGQFLASKEGVPLMLIKGSWELRRKSERHKELPDSRRFIIPRFTEKGAFDPSQVIAIQINKN